MIPFLVILAFILILTTTSDATNNLRGNTLEGLPEPRIIGGSNVEDSRHPYFVYMWDGGLCGGALIAPDIVITAAHCEEADVKVVIGEHNLYTDKDSETIPIEEKIVHPLYNIDPKTFSNDVMIVKLTQKSKKPTLKLRQAPIIEEQQRLTAIGYGVITLSNEVDIPETLQEVELGYISNEVCALMHAKEDITDDMMCTLESGKDACTGDSGGPLIIKGNSFEEDRLVGTVAWGRGCADERFPGVFSRVSWFYDWIVNTTCAMSDQPPDYFNCDGKFVGTTAPRNTPPPGGSSAPTSITSTPTLSPAPSRAPSISSAPTSSAAPSISPTDSFAPSHSIEPSSSPSESSTPTTSFAPSNSPSISSAPSTSSAPSSPPSESRAPSTSASPSSPPSVSSAPSTSAAPSSSPSVSRAPSTSSVPSSPPSDSFAPSSAPTTSAPSSTPSETPESDILSFLGWDSIEPLRHCQGDCHRDADCAGDLICFERSSRSSKVPGCRSSGGFVPSIADFCIYPIADDRN